jgi:parallel beta-helix repeat protein
LGKVGGGNTIILESGTYAPFSVPLGDGGTSAHPTVIESQTKWQAIINGALSLTVAGITGQPDGAGGNTDYLTIENLKVVNAGTVGIALGGNWDIVQNCWITGSKNSGILASSVNNDTIQNNLIEHNGTSTQSDDGICLSGSGDVISGNIVRHNSALGLDLSGSPQNCTVSGNLFYAQQSGMDIEFSGTVANADNTVTNNTFLSSTESLRTYGPDPISVWSGNRLDPTVSGASLDSITSNNMADYTKALTAILPAAAGTDVTPPTASVTDSGVYGGQQSVWVTYTDNQTLNLAKISPNNVIINGPGGYSAPAQSVALMQMTGNSGTLVVVYSLTPPSGGWTSANNGSYTVSLQPNQVCDLAGNYAASGTMPGGFSMTFTAAPPPPPPPVNTFYVSPTGSTSNTGTQSSPWPSVAYALGQVGGGKTIVLEPGTYAPFSVPLGDGGTSASPTVIESQVQWQAVIDGTLNPAVAGIASQPDGAGGNTDYLSIEGFKVVHAGTYGINLGGNWDVIQNCWVTGSTNTGILASSVNNNTIQNNLIEDNGTSTQSDDGICLSGTGDVINGNIVRHNSALGLDLSGSLQNCTVSGNLFYGQQSGMDVEISVPLANADTTITNNTFLSSTESLRTYGPDPISVWSGNQVDPTLSGASLDSITSSNMADYANALALILPAPAGTDVTPPTASVTDSGVDGGQQAVWVTYTDNQSLNLAQISPNNVIINGPGGYSAPAQSAGLMQMTGDSGTLVVVYSLTPPSGGWTSANNGSYTVSLQPNQVCDLAGNYAPAGTISGGFSMTFTAAPPPPPPAITGYYVSPTGSTSNTGTQSSPWPSVTYALSQVGGGHTFILEPGTYAPFMVPVGDGGTSANPTVIESQVKWQAVIDGTLNPAVDAVVTEDPNSGGTTNYVTFNGLKVVNSGATGIDLGGDYDVAENCWVTGSTNTGIGSWGHSYITIQNNLIENNGTSTQFDHGIYLIGNWLDVTGNIVRHNAACGITTTTYALAPSIISGNLVYGNLMNFEFEGDADSLTITNNILLAPTNNPSLPYDIAALRIYGTDPIGVWSGNQVESSISGSSLDSISSSNMADYSNALALILPAPAGTDVTPPTASVTDSGPDGGQQAVWVTYTDAQSLNLADISQSNVIINGPDGYSAPAASVAIMQMIGDNGSLVVMYHLTPPAGGWTSANDGNYTVSLQPNQVSDLAGNYALPGTIPGGFSMTF